MIIYDCYCTIVVPMRVAANNSDEAAIKAAIAIAAEYPQAEEDPYISVNFYKEAGK